MPDNAIMMTLPETTMARGYSRPIAAACLILAALLPNAALAQKPSGLPGGYPAKPVRILIGLAAGGIVAMDALNQSTPDGYTWLSSGTRLELGVAEASGIVPE